MSPQHRILVLLAHPNLATSRLNRVLADAVAGMAGVTVRDLAWVRAKDGYDVAVEQQLLVEHDSIVWQFPWYWDAAPALLKEWMEQVLTYGFAYGSDATALRGKPLQVVTTTGAPEFEYRPEGLHLATMAELMRPLDATANVCEMEFVEPFIVYGARSVDDAALAAYSADYRRLLGRTQLRATA